MLWILRRTGAANFFNSINNNYVGRSNSVNFCNGSGSGKNNSRNRFRYGRLNGDSDEQKFDQNDVLVDESSLKYPCCDGMRQDNVDQNGNNVGSDRKNNFNNNNNKNRSNQNIINNNLCINDQNDDIGKGKVKKTISRLQAIGMTDDEDDIDDSLCCNVCDRVFQCPKQLASHQQKKRHFGCGGCDTLFPSLMLLEHHKEEYEHWSDSEEYQSCCHQNRRDDYTDSETCTSDAESEDLERLL